MKSLVIYYSFEGNSKAAAEKTAELTGADIVRITTEQEPPREGRKKFMKGGAQALRGFRPEIHTDPVDYSLYDTIYIAGPVWAGTFAPAMGTYLERHPFSGKKVFLIGCSTSGKADRMFRKMRDLLKDNTVEGEINLKDPLKNPEELEKLDVLKNED
jgi:flavodoxin